MISALLLYEYLLHVHKDARIMDLWRRIDAAADMYFRDTCVCTCTSITSHQSIHINMMMIIMSMSMMIMIMTIMKTIVMLMLPHEYTSENQTQEWESPEREITTSSCRRHHHHGDAVQ